jgi:hypothetical protein
MTLPVPVRLSVGHRTWCIGGLDVAGDQPTARLLADLLRATADELDTSQTWHEIITREFGS